MGLLTLLDHRPPRGTPSSALVALFGSDFGWYLDPIDSAFYKDDAYSVAAASSGVDTVSRWQDLSPNGIDHDQATTASRPVFYTANGLKWVRGGDVGGVQRHLAGEFGASKNISAYTRYMIFESDSGTFAHAGYITNNGLSAYEGLGWNNNENSYIFNSSVSGATSIALTGHPPVVSRIVKSGTGAGQVAAYTNLNNADFVDDAYDKQTTFTSTVSTGVTKNMIGWVISNPMPVNVLFDFTILRVLNAEEQAIVQARMKEILALGWSP